MNYDRPLSEEELASYRFALKRAAKGEPIEYIMGEIEFYHCKLKITSDVLIPRPETEIMLDMICKRLDGSEKSALDICTGSGCLAIGLKNSFPEMRVTGVDLSEKALAVARGNSGAVTWLCGDLTEPVKESRFDLVMCNPPYVSEKEYPGLDSNVREFEPRMALVSGPTGYEFYERLSIELPPILNRGAKVFFEIGADQGEGIQKIFSQALWEGHALERDWAGHNRFFSLKLKEFSPIMQ